MSTNSLLQRHLASLATTTSYRLLHRVNHTRDFDLLLLNEAGFFTHRRGRWRYRWGAAVLRAVGGGRKGAGIYNLALTGSVSLAVYRVQTALRLTQADAATTAARCQRLATDRHLLIQSKDLGKYLY